MHLYRRAPACAYRFVASCLCPPDELFALLVTVFDNVPLFSVARMSVAVCAATCFPLYTQINAHLQTSHLLYLCSLFPGFYILDVEIRSGCCPRKVWVAMRPLSATSLETLLRVVPLSRLQSLPTRQWRRILKMMSTREDVRTTSAKCAPFDANTGIEVDSQDTVGRCDPPTLVGTGVPHRQRPRDVVGSRQSKEAQSQAKKDGNRCDGRSWARASPRIRSQIRGTYDVPRKPNRRWLGALCTAVALWLGAKGTYL